MNRDKELYDIGGQIELRERSKRPPGDSQGAQSVVVRGAKKKPRKRGEMLG